MKTQCFGVMALVLGMAAYAGCSERTGKPVAQVEAPAATAAPVAAQPAPTAATPVCPAPTPCPVAAAPLPSRTATEPRKPALSSDDHLVIKRLVLAEGVKNREPVSPGMEFKGDKGKIYAFVEVENHDGAPSEIVVEFEPPGGGASHGDVKLSVGAAPRWRTWAYTRTASIAGSWTAVVKNKKGDVLARAPFEVSL